MAIRHSPPSLSAQATDKKLLRKIEERRNNQIFRNVIGGVLAAHFLFSVTLVRGGMGGYLSGWKSLFVLFQAQPLMLLVPMAALVALHRGIAMYRHPDSGVRVLPPFPPVPDLRFTNDIYIGSAWTRDGKQPMETVSLDEEVFEGDECHVILKELGLYGNCHVKGGIGAGKTSSLIMPFLAQAITKWSKPAHPDAFPLGAGGKIIPGAAGGPQGSRRSPMERLKGKMGAPADAPEPEPMTTGEQWEPFVGLTREEALQKYAELLDQHERKKWGIFLLDPKGDMTEQVQRLAKIAGREKDFISLRPDGEYTYNPLTVSASPLVQAEMVMDGIEAVSGQSVQQYWRSTMSEWLTNALEILRVVEPNRITFKNLLRMARSEALCQRLVTAAEAVYRMNKEEEERLRRIGQTYTGVRVNDAAIEFFRDWLDEDADPSRKQGVVSGVKSQAKFFVDDKTAPFLCPEMPPTFPGFDEMIDQGRIVVLSCPLDEFGPVAKVLGILVLCDAQQAARSRINKPEMNQERVLLFCVDEIANYLNPATRDFVSMSRQSKVCFLGAHQSQAQLLKQDKSFENSFNDNFRTKMSYCAPNAISGRSESALFGGRQVYKERVTENKSFAKVERVAGADAVNPHGGESQSFSVSVDEVDRPWFAPEDFMSLRMGEMIILPFDGETQLVPRKIKCPQFFKTSIFKRMWEIEIESQKRPPHPVVFVGADDEDLKYLNAGLMHAGYVVIEALADDDGDLAGFKFVTDVGSIVVELAALETTDAQSLLEERLTHPQTLILFADFTACAQFFVGQLGLQMERVAALSDLYRRAFPESSGVRLGDIIQERTGEARAYEPKGSWGFNASLTANHGTILRDSRAICHLFSDIGARLVKIKDEELEVVYEQTRERIASILSGEDPDPTPDPTGTKPDGPHSDPSELEEEPEAAVEEEYIQEPGDISAPFASDQDDPFLADAYPDDLPMFEEPLSGDFASHMSSDDVGSFDFEEPAALADAVDEIESTDFEAALGESAEEAGVGTPGGKQGASPAPAPAHLTTRTRKEADLAEIARRQIAEATRLMDETDIGPLDQTDSVEYLFDPSEQQESRESDEVLSAITEVADDVSDEDVGAGAAAVEEEPAPPRRTARRRNSRPARRTSRKPSYGETLDFGFDADPSSGGGDAAGGTGPDSGDSDDGFGAPL